MNTIITYLGLDIAKRSLDLSPHPAGTPRTFSNDAAGHRDLVAALRQVGGSIQIICEATGGYEHHLLAALHEAQVAVTLVNPRQVRDFARAKGLLAKTDSLMPQFWPNTERCLNPRPRWPSRRRSNAWRNWSRAGRNFWDSSRRNNAAPNITTRALWCGRPRACSSRCVGT